MNAWLPRSRGQWLALGLGVLALAACLLLGLMVSARQAMLSYLFAFVFFCGLSVGSLALLMVHVMTGGAWGYHLRPALLSAARVLPLMALLAIPVLVGMHVLYAWSHADVLAHDLLLRKQSWYLNPTFFVIRTVLYFTLWCLLLALFTRCLARPETLPRVAAPGLILFAISSLLAGTDWTVSLLPHWSSSTYGMMFATGWILAAMALATLIAMGRPDAADAHPPPLRHDYGNLLLVLVLGWSYLAFMQYLTIWVADMPTENVWYLPRTLTSWAWLGRFLIAFHFAVPFVILLSRRAKRSRTWMGAVAAMLLAANLGDALWLVVPNFRADGFMLRWSDLAAVLGVGALWYCVWLGQWRVMRVSADASPSSSTWTHSHG